MTTTDMTKYQETNEESAPSSESESDYAAALQPEADQVKTPEERPHKAKASPDGKPPVRKTIGTVIAAVISGFLVIALFLYLLVERPLPWLSDAQVSTSSQMYTVSQTEQEQVCPGRMSLVDSGSYGDSQYQVSEGNITSSMRAVAVGKVYRSQIANLDGSSPLALVSPAGKDAQPIAVLSRGSGQASAHPFIQISQLTKASAGTGAAASVASWASQGDLRGVAATSCIPVALSQTFLAPSTRTGWTQQLILVNPSSKATVATLKVHGSGNSQALALSANSSVTVGAHSQAKINLSASAANQDGLLVSVTSSESPLSGYIQAVRSQGLNSEGNDYVSPSPAASQRLVIGTLANSKQVSLLLYGARSGTAHLTWLGTNGQEEESFQNTISFTGGKVGLIRLAAIPSGAAGIAITSSQPIRASVLAESSQKGGSDFALITGRKPSSHAALTVPADTKGTVVISNARSTDCEANLQSYDRKGRLVKTQKISLSAYSSQSFSLADSASSPVAFVLKQTSPSLSALSMALSLSVPGLSPSLSQVAAVNSVNLASSAESIRIQRGPVL